MDGRWGVGGAEFGVELGLGRVKVGVGVLGGWEKEKSTGKEKVGVKRDKSIR